MATTNWTELFSGFEDVGTALGGFVTNLVFGIAPAIIGIGIFIGIIVIIGAVIGMVVKSVNKAGTSMGKNK